MFSARLFDKISSLTVQCAQRSNCLVKFLDFLFIKPDVLKAISHIEWIVLFISVYDIFGRSLRMIYIIVFTIILIRKEPRN